jgi:hypothetical protein
MSNSFAEILRDEFGRYVVVDKRGQVLFVTSDEQRAIEFMRIKVPRAPDPKERDALLGRAVGYPLPKDRAP